jgi:hypothetical protein
MRGSLLSVLMGLSAMNLGMQNLLQQCETQKPFILKTAVKV